jgi:hypothetical protein
MVFALLSSNSAAKTLGPPPGPGRAAAETDHITGALDGLGEARLAIDDGMLGLRLVS